MWLSERPEPERHGPGAPHRPDEVRQRIRRTTSSNGFPDIGMQGNLDGVVPSMVTIRLGTSGWNHRDWEGVFYPKNAGEKLVLYSKVFDTVEMDSTFYGFPRRAMIQACSRIAPEGFTFSVRVPRVITHDKELDVRRGAGRDLMRFLYELRPIEDSGKLGPVIFQLPQGFTYENGLRRLIDFFGALPADLRFAVEFRNRSWRRPETWDLLRQCKIANVIADQPQVPPDMTITADFAMIKWHGRGVRPWTDYRYAEAEIGEWALTVKRLEGSVGEVYGYFENRFRAYAVENALAMMDKLGLAGTDQRAWLSRSEL